MSAGTYPVRVDATFDAPVSRGLWIVKGILLIPHYIVLVFLWMAFVVLSIVAFFAILVTGRYPRAVFDFDVGVLRWSWRVSYYAFGAFGTDRYPPFSLADDPAYPAHLDIDYPAGLSRGLVLIKWWLLAIPHYLLLGLFTGGGVWLGTRAEQQGGWQVATSVGLIQLLAVFAVVVLLFTGRYPSGIFDLVLGLNRWVLRVAAYAALMTDAYPPFRLDLGGADPAGLVVGPGSGPEPDRAAAAPPRAEQPPQHRTGWTGGRVVTVVLGVLVGLVALPVAGVGAAALVADTAAREGGYVQLGSGTYSTAGYAVVSDPVQLHLSWAGVDLARDDIGSVRVSVTSTGGWAGVRRHRPDRRGGPLPRRGVPSDGPRDGRCLGDDARRRRRTRNGTDRGRDLDAPGLRRRHADPALAGQQRLVDARRDERGRLGPGLGPR